MNIDRLTKISYDYCKDFDASYAELVVCLDTIFDYFTIRNSNGTRSTRPDFEQRVDNWLEFHNNDKGDS